jgi:nucleoid-associated protein YgaU
MMPEEKSPYDDVMKDRKEAIEKSKAEEAKSEYEPLENFKVKTTHTVAAGENLSMISEKYYKTGVNWIYIYRANMGVIGDNPDIIQAGMELKIPAL